MCGFRHDRSAFEITIKLRPLDTPSICPKDIILTHE
jgi:hypothetical protein